MFLLVVGGGVAWQLVRTGKSAWFAALLSSLAVVAVALVLAVYYSSAQLGYIAWSAVIPSALQISVPAVTTSVMYSLIAVYLRNKPKR